MPQVGELLAVPSAALSREERRDRNAEIIRAVLQDTSLTQRQGAALVHVPWETFRAWMKPGGRNAASDAHVELLCLKAGVGVPEWLRVVPE